MKFARIFPLALLLALALNSSALADTLRVVSYNALNLRGSTMGPRTEHFLTVMESIQPDVAVLQEIIDEDAVDNLLSFVFLQIEDDWQSVPFHNGPDTDNTFLFRSSKVEFISQRVIPTTLRDINEYVIRPLSMDSTARVRLYSAHLKASQGSTNEERRRQEAETLRQQLDLLPEGSMFMFMGDFNLYTAEEPAYQLLLDSEPGPGGQLFDPIDRYGNWHTSISFADVHTQSSRVNGDGGAGGGMDDRFDFILVSTALMNPVGGYVLPDTYAAWGNDGQHFDQAVNNGVNHAVSAEVADALRDASDHLPVVADFVFETVDEVDSFPALTANHELLTCYPNPFNSRLSIDIPGLASQALLTIFDLQGRILFSELLPENRRGSTLRSYDFTQYSTGIYFIRLSGERIEQTQKVLLLK